MAESTGANIFLAMGGELVTPKVENFLDGITRRAVMGMAGKRGWAVKERAVMPEELDEASEVFLCGTAAELVLVGAIDDRRYQIGPMTRTLMDGLSGPGASARQRGLRRVGPLRDRSTGLRRGCSTHAQANPVVPGEGK